MSATAICAEEKSGFSRLSRGKLGKMALGKFFSMPFDSFW